MKVLLTIDSSHASPVIDEAAVRLWPSGTVFCVMSVVDMRHWEGLPALIEDAKCEAQSLVTNALDKLTQSGHRAFSEITVGFPKNAIPKYAKQWGADLIMVGSHHGQNAATRFFLGSVARAVLRAAPCSVEIVRHNPASQTSSHGTRILLATDGSECSVKAVYSVANRPWPAQSEIRLLSVVQLVTPEISSTASPLCSPYPSSLLEQIWKEARTRAEEAVADARKTLTAAGLKVCDCNATPVGEPRGFILDEAKAWGADLIVLGSHGRHGLERLLMGSVAETVSIYAHCSVEVIRG
jgi:nucleotide-binding universal stress UspA family protein